jgi:hypothetical protein
MAVALPMILVFVVALVVDMFEVVFLAGAFQSLPRN